MLDFDTRYRRWLRRFEAHRLDGFLVTHPPNLSYLFNFTGSTGLACCLSEESYLIVDSRYIEQASSQCINCHPMLAEKSLEDTLRAFLRSRDRLNSHKTRIGIEAKRVSYDFMLRIQSWETQIEWIPTRDLIEEIRMIKDTAETQIIEQAFQIAQHAYGRLVDKIRSGMQEIEVAGILEFELRKAGGEGPSFETIVASGPRSSLPHGSATAKRIESDELVLIDFGVKYHGYCSDLTRIYLSSNAKRPEIYQVVKEAQNKALSLIKPGVLSSEINAAARKVIGDQGYGDYFGHSTGHGLGLEVHELPTISAHRPREIREGMVFTVEPGIYLPRQYGVRLEDA
ncbi:aminopeptidase P family protein, partial [Acidobacteria bacterium AH-259-A15]|nr:aminopeptidase P family protein [Acidobacteria bacterium AH-259-A15]